MIAEGTRETIGRIRASGCSHGPPFSVSDSRNAIGRETAVSHYLNDVALQAALTSWSSEATKLRQKGARDYEDLVAVTGMLRTAAGVISDDLDVRLKGHRRYAFWGAAYGRKIGPR